MFRTITNMRRGARHGVDWFRSRVPSDGTRPIRGDSLEDLALEDLAQRLGVALAIVRKLDDEFRHPS